MIFLLYQKLSATNTEIGYWMEAELVMPKVHQLKRGTIFHFQ